MISGLTYSIIAGKFDEYILELQNKICNEVEYSDGKEKFLTDNWTRDEGGGGISRIINDGAVFEKGGVNTSKVFGKLPLAMQEVFNVPESNFLACGLSLVLHPRNPYVPTVPTKRIVMNILLINIAIMKQGE